ncbi:MAG TPA: hypothetical protein VEA41_04055, partial [Salinarimonas sp.]|nr:hypothetical protein [Salinarimonas sp.]
KYPFPTWLYGAGTIEYLRAMMGWNLVDTTEWRLRYMAGLEKRARPDGYVDYGPLLDAKPQSRRDQHKRVGDTPLNTTDSYPAIDLLRSLIARFPAEAKVVLVRPPVYVTALPAKGTPAEAAAETCRAKMRELAAERPNTALVDWHGYHRPESYDAEAFYDHTHYTNPVARALEADIAAAFERLPGGRR